MHFLCNFNWGTGGEWDIKGPAFINLTTIYYDLKLTNRDMFIFLLDTAENYLMPSEG